MTLEFEGEHIRKPFLSIEKQQSHQRETSLLLLGFTNFVINLGVSQIAPFYSPLAANEADLSYTQIGLIFCLNPLGSALCSFTMMNFVYQWGRKRTIITALVTQCSVQFMFGSLVFLTQEKNIFLAISILSRTLQGISRALYSAAAFSYVPILWKNEVQKKLRFLESMTVLGLLLGPIIGGAQIIYFSFAVPFYLSASILFLMIVPICITLPSDEELQACTIKQRVYMLSAMKSVKILITVICIITVNCGYTFFTPYFCNHMTSFGVEKHYTALIITLPGIFYLVFVQLVPMMQKYVQRTFIISLAVILCFIGNMITAPFWGNTNSIVPTLFGLSLIGIAQAFSTNPSIPQFMDLLAYVIKQQPKSDAQSTNIGDMASSLFVASMALGSVIGPFIGGLTYDAFGGNINSGRNRKFAAKEQIAFHNALLTVCVVEVFVFFLYLAFGNGYKGWWELLRKLSTKSRKEPQPIVDDEVFSDTSASSEAEQSPMRESEF